MSKQEKYSGYELSRAWFDFAFENPEKVRPLHAAIFFFAIEHCNRLGWKKKFGFPTQMAMEAIGVRKYDTYINALRDLIDWGFIHMIEKSKNQYSSNVISIGSGTPDNDNALDKALICHTKKRQSTGGGMGQSTGQSTGQSIVSINKQVTSNKEQEYVTAINNILGKQYRLTEKIAPKIKKILTEYTMPEIKKAVKHARADEYHKQNQWKHLTPEFFTRSDKVEKWLNATNGTPQPHKQEEIPGANIPRLDKYANKL